MRKYVIPILTLVVFAFSNCSNGQDGTGDSNEIDAATYAKKIKELPGSPIIDVRTPEEFEKGHLENAKNMNWNANDFKAQISVLDKSKAVFVYCLSGGRSASAAEHMRSIGFDKVYEMEGGILKWRAANLPGTTGSGKSAGMSRAQFDSLTNSDKMILIDFYADWCAPCKKMKPYLEEISRDSAEKLLLVRINTDDNQQLCKELGIDAIPVLKLYKNKSISWTHQGFISKEDLLKKLEE